MSCIYLEKRISMKKPEDNVSNLLGGQLPCKSISFFLFKA